MIRHYTTTRLSGACVCTLLITLAGSVLAADRPVTLKAQLELSSGVAAMPQIDAPADDAERRVNAALPTLDGKVRKAAHACRAEGGARSSWTRTIRTPMRGPRLVSFAITEAVYCGGAYPNTDVTAIVYDLTTGAPVDWTTLLPPALTGTVALAQGQDGTKMVTLAPKRLLALYRESYRLTGSRAKSEGDDAVCREAVAETPLGEPPAMMAWPDAEAGGLGVQFSLIHALQACADTVVISNAVLRREGAQSALTDAIEAAHGAR